MKVLLLGARGQLGTELARTLKAVGEVRALDRRSLDLTDGGAVRAAARSAGADVIVNAAAYTHVDRAESERDLSYAVNAEAPAILAAEAAQSDALLVHFSTDYVFDGKIERPYREDDSPAPLNVYGASKLAGDDAVLASGAQALVFRISWVYSRSGENFLNKIERLASERDELRVVSDQHGSPTWARPVAISVTQAIEKWGAADAAQRAALTGLYHMTSPDYTSWHGFAASIVAQMELPGKRVPRVTPIPTEQFPTAAHRPRWSVMDSRKLRDAFGVILPPWREQLAECMASG